MLTLTAWTTNGFDLCLLLISVAEPQSHCEHPEICFDSASNSFSPGPRRSLCCWCCAVFPRCRYAAPLRQPRCSALQSQPPEQTPTQPSFLTPPSRPSLPCPAVGRISAASAASSLLRDCSRRHFLLSAITDRRRRLHRHLAHRLASTSASLASASAPAFNHLVRRGSRSFPTDSQLPAPTVAWLLPVSRIAHVDQPYRAFRAAAPEWLTRKTLLRNYLFS